jgi:hypothetical protein
MLEGAGQARKLFFPIDPNHLRHASIQYNLR